MIKVQNLEIATLEYSPNQIFESQIHIRVKFEKGYNHLSYNKFYKIYALYYYSRYYYYKDRKKAKIYEGFFRVDDNH
jgi:hypothetical protein